MKIAVNVRLLQNNKLEGIGTFIDETLSRIVKSNPDIDFHFFFDRPFNDKFVYADNVVPHIITPPTRLPILVNLWFNFLIPRKMNRLGIKYLLSADNMGTLSDDVECHLTVHDLNHHHRPKDLPKRYRKFYKRFAPKFVRKAAGIATVSNYSKQDIVNTYGVDPNKIDVVFNAAKDIFQVLPESKQKEFRSKYNSGRPYFMYVGALHPRKNMPNLLKGFNEFAANNKDVDLLVIGEVMFKDSAVGDIIENSSAKDRIHFLGRKSDEELAEILGSSIGLVYVPFFEGFGIPIVEAFASGTAVITSNVTSLPEVAGKGALLVDPNQSNEIASAMDRLAKDHDLRKELVEYGQKELLRFSWDKTAKLYWESVCKTFDIKI